MSLIRHKENDSMRNPFKKPVPASPSPHLVDALKAELLPELRQQARSEVLQEFHDVAEKAVSEVRRGAITAAGEMLAAPDPSMTHSPHPLYAFNRPWTWAVPVDPMRRPGSLLTVDTLRQMADNYDILRGCILHLQDEVSAVPLSFVPKEDGDDSPATKKEIEEAKFLFSTEGPIGGIGTRRHHFENELIEDLCVIGAGAVYLEPTRGGGLYEALAIDAGTIRPRVDVFGWPGPNDEWFEQWVMGVKIRGFFREEMLYDGIYKRSWTPYFASPTEWLINVVNAALRADDWNRRWLTDGNIPDQIIGLPEEWTPEQVIAFSQYFDGLLAGNSAERRKIRFVPSGGKPVETFSRKDQDFQVYELWLLRRTCAIMGVQPASLGFTGEQYKVTQEESMQATTQFGVGKLLEFRVNLYNTILEHRKLYRIQASNVTAKEEDAGDRKDRNVAYVSGGIFTPNEARATEGKEPIPGGDSLLVNNTLVPLEQLADMVAAKMQPPVVMGQPGQEPSGGDKGKPAPKNPPKGPLPGKAGKTLTGQKAPDLPDMFAGKGSTPKNRAEAIQLFTRKALNRLKERQETGKAGSRSGGKPVGEVPFTHAALHPCEVSLAQVYLARAETPEMVRDAIGTLNRCVYVVRHGSTAMNASGQSRGWMDPPLDETGEQQAQAIADFFVGMGIESIRVSNLERAEETARIISAVIGAPIIETSIAYRPWDIGEWAGRSCEDAEPVLADYLVNRTKEAVPGGESACTFLCRLLNRVKHIFSCVEKGDESRPLIVTHSRDLRAIAAWIERGCLKDVDGADWIDTDCYLQLPVTDCAVLGCYLTPNGWDALLMDPLPDSYELQSGHIGGAPANLAARYEGYHVQSLIDPYADLIEAPECGPASERIARAALALEPAKKAFGSKWRKRRIDFEQQLAAGKA